MSGLIAVRIVASCGFALAGTSAIAGEHDHHAMQMAGHAQPKMGYEREVGQYEIPAVDLINQDGKKIRLDRMLAENRPTLVQFIFTSCTTICPVMGAVFGGAQDDIAAVAPDYRMVSISIDPEYDTPERLREFAEKHDAHGDWELLTGSSADIQNVIKAFDVLNQGDNKMYHQPYTFIRWKPDSKWTRLRGLMSVADLVKEFVDAKAPMTN